MLRLRLYVDVMTSPRISVWRSDLIEGNDAEEVREMINNLSELKMFSFPCQGKMVFMNRGILEQAVITVEEFPDETAD